MRPIVRSRLMWTRIDAGIGSNAPVPLQYDPYMDDKVNLLLLLSFCWPLAWGRFPLTHPRPI